VYYKGNAPENTAAGKRDRKRVSLHGPSFQKAMKAGVKIVFGTDVGGFPWTEPIAQDNPLLALDNVILTPHSICWTDEFFRNNAESAFRSVVAVASGKTPAFVVNRDVIEHDKVRARLVDPHR